YFKDVKGKFVLCSRSKSAFHGFEHPEEILNLSDFDLYSEKHAFKAYTDEKNIMKSGEPMVDTEEITEMANGDHLWCTTTKMPLYDSNHEVIGTFGISKDITEQKKLERELKFKNGRLQKLVDHLFYDLKVPIRGLKSIGESILMESRKSLSSQSRKDFEMFLNRADQILGYIDDAAKELSRNEAHTSEIS
ncbi:MAG: PAS domain-containing protein, partial [Cyclobacteriaceae bacterium]|nr:PAS domain-containing protein [Cyclobacteriaceae bacterium HetDA_MAG_MS6]